MRRKREENFFDFIPMIVVFSIATWIVCMALYVAIIRWVGE